MRRILVFYIGVYSEACVVQCHCWLLRMRERLAGMLNMYVLCVCECVKWCVLVDCNSHFFFLFGGGRGLMTPGNIFFFQFRARLGLLPLSTIDIRLRNAVDSTVRTYCASCVFLTPWNAPVFGKQKNGKVLISTSATLLGNIVFPSPVDSLCESSMNHVLLPNPSIFPSFGMRRDYLQTLSTPANARLFLSLSLHEQNV